jgi:hypothetical protein
MGWLNACFAELPDPRIGNAKRHDLIEAVTFDEDPARNRCHHGAENLAIRRKLALDGLRSARRDISVRRTGWSDDFARSIPGHMR